MHRRHAHHVARLSETALPGKELTNVIPRVCCIDAQPPATNGKPRPQQVRAFLPPAAPTAYTICIPPKKAGMRRPVPD